jgi:hypothetical protein
MERRKSQFERLRLLRNLITGILVVGLILYLCYGLSMFRTKHSLKTILNHPNINSDSTDQNLVTPRPKKESVKHYAVPFSHPVKRSAVNTHDLRRPRSVAARFFHNVN